MLKLMDLLTEGIQDKGIFKAVFMAGGPGSGKTFINSQLFGIPEKGLGNIGISGLKSVNSDREYMYLLKKFGFDPSELANYPDDVFNDLGAPLSQGGSGLRDMAQALKAERKKGYMAGKLGMVIDSTASNFQKVKRQKKELEEHGYDTYMVFVMTSLDVALQRNTARAEKGERELPKALVTKSWKAARKNVGVLKALFGSNFKLVSNDKHLKPKEAKHAFSSLVKKYAVNWVNEPIKNPIGKQWVKDQLRLKKAGLDKGIPKRSKGIGYK